MALAQAYGFPIHAGAARNWPTAAVALGYTVNAEPTVGSVIVTKESSAGTNTGHVAIVTAVSDTSITLLEQNYRGAYIVSTRTVERTSPIVSSAAFIHHP